MGLDDKYSEDEKVRKLRTAVDLARSLLIQSDITYEEALRLVEAVKSFTLNLFPDKEATFELIYRPRFDRIIKEKYISH